MLAIVEMTAHAISTRLTCLDVAPSCREETVIVRTEATRRGSAMERPPGRLSHANSTAQRTARCTKKCVNRTNSAKDVRLYSAAFTHYGIRSSISRRSQGSARMKIVFALLLLLHGLIHLSGTAKAFGIADMPQLTQQISKPMGIVWLCAALLFVVTTVALLSWPARWWMIGAAAQRRGGCRSRASSTTSTMPRRDCSTWTRRCSVFR